MATLANFLRSLSSTDPDNPLGDQPGEALDRVRGMRKDRLVDVLRETPEMAATLATALPAQVTAGLTGAINAGGTLARGGSWDEAVDRGVKDIKTTQDALTYAPKSAGAQRGLGYVGEAIEPINELAKKYVADPIGKVSPALGALATALPAVVGPGEAKGAVEVAGTAARTAAKAAKAAARGVEATESVAAPVEAATAPLLDRLQAAQDAHAAHAADPSPVNQERLSAATAALREEPPGAAAPDPGQSYRDAPEALPAAMRVVRIAEDSGMIGSEASPERDALFNRAFTAARDRIAAGGSQDDALNAAHHAAFSRPEPQTGADLLTARIAADRERRGGAPLPGSTLDLQQRAAEPPAVGALAPEHEARLPEVDPGGWMTTEGAQDPQAIAARSRVLARRLLGDVDEHGTEFLNTVDKLRYRMEQSSGRGQGPSGDDWIPEPPVTRPPSMSPAELQAHGIVLERLHRYEMEGASQPLIEQTRLELESIRRGEGDPARIESINAQADRNAQIRAGGTTPQSASMQAALRTPITGAADDLRTRAVMGAQAYMGQMEREGRLSNGLRRVFEQRIEQMHNGELPDSHMQSYADFAPGGSRYQQAPRGSAAGPEEVTAFADDPHHQKDMLVPGGVRPDPEQLALPLPSMQRELRRGDPKMNRESVLAFYEGGRDNPHMFQYGVDPLRTGEVSRGAGLEEYADAYNQRFPEARAEIHRGDDEPGEMNWEDYDHIDVDPEYLRHGRYEQMRDRHGDIIEDKKKHEEGDYPVYDEEGNVRYIEGVTSHSGQPKKYKALADELRRDEEGNPMYTPRLSEGGERMRDESGDYKTDATHDEEAYLERLDQARMDAYEEDRQNRRGGGGDGDIQLTAARGGDMTLYSGRTMDAQANKGPYGSLLYQILLNEASHGGGRIGGGTLSHVNALRILSNANSNYARTGINPRGLRGTASGDLPTTISDNSYRDRAHPEFAEGPEIWRSESDEALKRAIEGGRSYEGGGKPERMGFDPAVGFTLDGQPATEAQLKAAVPSMSPGIKDRWGDPGSGVGIKTLMRSAVFDWLRDASPEEAAKVAQGWGKKYGPLFGVAGVGLSMQDALREKAQEGTQ